MPSLPRADEKRGGSHLMAEKDQITQKERLEEKALSESFAALASLLQEEGSAESLLQDPLFLACTVVGQALKIPFTEPKEESCSVNITDRIRAICESSGVRYRQIALEEEWYLEDGGHCIGFLGPRHQPVALLWTDRGGYALVDPVNRKEQKVDATLAAQISPVGFEFYGSFPSEKLTRKDAMKFSFFGKGKKVAFVFFIGALVALLNIVLPFSSKFIFGKVIPDLNEKALVQLGIALLIAALSTAIYQLTQGFLVFRITSLAGNRLEAAVWDRLLKLPIRFFKRFTVGDLFSRVNGFVTARRAFNNYYVSLLLNLCFSIFYLIVMVLFSPALSMAAILVIALSLVIYFFCQNRIVGFQRASYEIKGKINGFIVQLIAGIAKIRVSGAEKRAFSHWAQLYAEAKKNDLKNQYYNSAIETTFSMIPILSTFVIFSVVINFVDQSKGSMPTFHKILSAGDFFGFVTAFSFFSAAIITSIPAVSYLYKVLKPVWIRGAVIFEEPPEVDPRKREAGPLEGNLAVEQIVFRYDTKSPYVLHNVSFSVKAGEFVGIVGPSGSGKSTLIRLLLGFEQPETGTISYDGTDLAHLDLRSVRRQLGVVLQNGSLLAGTIYENLVCGGIYSQEQVEKAIHLAAFDNDLKKFPMGLHTLLSSGGETLSGGQKQRLLIARALISNPKILLFDEAMSALDNRTQKQISRNIEELHVSRVVIAHRLNTVKLCTRIYLLNRGVITEEGTFDELLKRSGLFAEMARRQKI